MYGDPNYPVSVPGARHLTTPGNLATQTAGAPAYKLCGSDPRRWSITIDNEGSGDLYVGEADKSGGSGGIRLAAGTSRTFAVQCELWVWVPNGQPLGTYRYAIETDAGG